MAIMKAKELRAMGKQELLDKMREIKTELSKEKGAVASGTKAENPGNIKQMRRTIARIKTILKERGEKE